MRISALCLEYSSIELKSSKELLRESVDLITEGWGAGKTGMRGGRENIDTAPPVEDRVGMHSVEEEAEE